MNDARLRHCSISVHDSGQDFEAMMPRAIQITVGELLGVLLAVRYFGGAMNASEAIVFCDDMAAIHATLKGGSAAMDLANMAYSLSHQLVELRTNIWYVPSASNLADGGSRQGVGRPMA